EDLVEVALGLAHVFADHAGEVELVEVELEIACDDFRAHGFAGARRSGEEDIDAVSDGEFALESPGAVDGAAMPHEAADLPELAGGLGREHDVVPAVPGNDLLRVGEKTLVGGVA